MTEVVLWTRVFDHSGPSVETTFWERAVEVEFLPGENDLAQLWEGNDGPLAPVHRRWWRPDGKVCVELVSITNNGGNGSSAMKDGRLQWVPLRIESRKLAELLRSAGWDTAS